METNERNSLDVVRAIISGSFESGCIKRAARMATDVVKASSSCWPRPKNLDDLKRLKPMCRSYAEQTDAAARLRNELSASMALQKEEDRMAAWREVVDLVAEDIRPMTGQGASDAESIVMKVFEKIGIPREFINETIKRNISLEKALLMAIRGEKKPRPETGTEQDAVVHQQAD